MISAALIVVVLIVLRNWGKDFYHDYQLSSTAAGHFHQLLDQGDLATIYADATDNFQRAAAREDELQFLEMVHQKMGNSGKTSTLGFHVSRLNGRLLVDQFVDTEFSLGHAKESFVWVIWGEQARLDGYHIGSPNLQ